MKTKVKELVVEGRRKIHPDFSGNRFGQSLLDEVAQILQNRGYASAEIFMTGEFNPAKIDKKRDAEKHFRVDFLFRLLEVLEKEFGYERISLGDGWEIFMPAYIFKNLNSILAYYGRSAKGLLKENK